MTDKLSFEELDQKVETLEAELVELEDCLEVGAGIDDFYTEKSRAKDEQRVKDIIQKIALYKTLM